MFEDLVSGAIEAGAFIPEILSSPKTGFTASQKVSASDELDAKFRTAQWIKELGGSTEEEALEEIRQREMIEIHHEVGDAFAAFTSPEATEQSKKNAVATLKTPAVVRELVGMLTAYNWAFVEQAQEIRSYLVSELLSEVKDNKDAKIRLKSIELLGKVTEIGLFTENIKVEKKNMSDIELDEELKQRLAQYASFSRAPEVVDGEIIPQIPEIIVETELKDAE
jgi:hypothetical protein